MIKNKLKHLIPILLSFSVLIISIFYFQLKKQEVSTHSITLIDIGFDTVITLNSECTDNDFDKFVDIIKTKYSYYNQLFDQYNEYEGIHNVYTLNHEAYDHPVEVDPILIDIIKLSFKMNQMNSKFDITQGNLLNLWHNYRTEGIELNNKGLSGTIPTEEEIKESQKHFGQEHILIKNNTIQFLDSEISIDLGGIAKGYATQKVREELVDNGCERGFINAGGNIVIIGEKSNGTPWKIGIQNPKSSQSIATLSISSNKSVVTSGDYQRFYTVGDQRYSHIIDPSTGYPATYMHSVTIVCDDSGIADALSTTLFCLPYKEGLQLVNELKKEMNIDAIWVLDSQGNGQIEKDNYSIYYTDDIQNLITY